MIVNQSADWGKEDEINISPDNIEVRFTLKKLKVSYNLHLFKIIEDFPLKFDFWSMNASPMSKDSKIHHKDLKF